MMGKKVQGVTVTSRVNTSSMGPYLSGHLQYQELRSYSKKEEKKNVYKWNGTGQLASLLFDCAFKNVAYFILFYFNISTLTFTLKGKVAIRQKLRLLCISFSEARFCDQ